MMDKYRVLSPADFSEFSRPLVGEQVSHIWRGFNQSVSLELGFLAPRVGKYAAPGNPQGEWTLEIESGWRIEEQRMVCCESEDEEETCRKIFQKLYRQSVAAVSLREGLPAIDVAFGNGLHLVSADSGERGPRWNLTRRTGGDPVTVSVQSGSIVVG